MFFDKTTQFRVVQQSKPWDIKGGYAKPVEFICQILDLFQRHPERVKCRCQASTAGSRKESGFQTFFLESFQYSKMGHSPISSATEGQSKHFLTHFIH